MNELIQKLKQQAGIDYNPDQEGLDLFAELIVRECQFAIVSRTDLPKHERKLYNKVLKEHFGVEE